MRTATAYLAYPALTSAGVAFGYLGINLGWPAWMIGALAFAGACALVAALEWYIPYSKAWAKPHGDRLTDFCHLLFSNRAFDIGTLVAVGLCVPLGRWLSERFGVSLWPHGWPIILQTLLAMLIYELTWYWMHRLEHASALLWRVHSVHHSSERLYWWNFSRNHPLDNLASAIAAVAPLALLGVGEAPLAVMASFSAAHGIMQHSNIDLRTGVLDLFFTTPRVHRWHHSPHRHEADSNFCPRLTLWDHVFGTYRGTADAIAPENVGLGAQGAGFPRTFLAQMLIPFRAEYWRAQHERPPC